MPQEDYIKKEIDKLGKVLAKVLADLLKLKSEGKSNEGTEAANVILKEELGFTLNSLVSLPENEFISYLVSEKKLNNTQLEYIADLLFESVQDPESGTAIAAYNRALLIYQRVTETEVNYSINRHFKIESIQRLLS